MHASRMFFSAFHKGGKPKEWKAEDMRSKAPCSIVRRRKIGKIDESPMMTLDEKGYFVL